MVLFLQRVASFLGSEAAPLPPTAMGAEWGIFAPSSSSSLSRPDVQSSQRSSADSSDATRCDLQSKLPNESRPLANRLSWPSGGAATLSGARGGFVASGVGPAPALLPPDLGLIRNTLLILNRGFWSFRDEGDFFNLQIFFFCLIWPMQETFGDEGSGVSYPRPGGFLPASAGNMGTIGPEKPLRACVFSLPGL